MKTFEAYLRSKGMACSTVKNYIKSVQKFSEWAKSHQIQVAQVSYNQLMDYVRFLKAKGIKQRSVQSHMSSLKHYFNGLVEHGLRKDNPSLYMHIRGIKRKKLYTIIDKAALEHIYHSYAITGLKIGEDSRIAKRNKIIVGLIVYQGLSTTALNSLEVGDVKLREGQITIREKRRSNARILKLEAHQMLEMMEYLLQTRASLLSEKGRESEQLFISKGTSDRLHNAIQKLLKKLKQQHKEIESLQQLRVSVIAYWLKTHNLREVQYMVGHRYVSSTECYLINNLDSLKEAIDKYHPLS